MVARYLPDQDFARVIRDTPLVSIDLIIRDQDRKVLVGLRTNEPAKNYYFVPGGVIRKNERIRDAFRRIAGAETGYQAELDEASFLGAFEHIYSSNRFGDPEYGTHYVVLAYALDLDHRPETVPDSQHTDLKWADEVDLVAAPDVHPNTKAYFTREPESSTSYLNPR
jgi:colanic acid biosynthesis protein WcaH